MLLPVLLPGVPRLVDFLGRLRERGEHAGQLLIEPGAERCLDRLHGGLPPLLDAWL